MTGNARTVEHKVQGELGKGGTRENKTSLKIMTEPKKARWSFLETYDTVRERDVKGITYGAGKGKAECQEAPQDGWGRRPSHQSLPLQAEGTAEATEKGEGQRRARAWPLRSPPPMWNDWGTTGSWKEGGVMEVEDEVRIHTRGQTVNVKLLLHQNSVFTYDVYGNVIHNILRIRFLLCIAFCPWWSSPPQLLVLHTLNFVPFLSTRPRHLLSYSHALPMLSLVYHCCRLLPDPHTFLLQLNWLLWGRLQALIVESKPTIIPTTFPLPWTLASSIPSPSFMPVLVLILIHQVPLELPQEERQKGRLLKFYMTKNVFIRPLYMIKYIAWFQIVDWKLFLPHNFEASVLLWPVLLLNVRCCCDSQFGFSLKFWELFFFTWNS